MIYRRIGFFLLIILHTSSGVTRSSHQSETQPQSSCAEVFSYESSSSSTQYNNRWYGNIRISTDVTLYGVWVDVVLDRQAVSIGNWFGDVSSTDNTEFKIQNTRHILTPGSPTIIRFYVIYDTALPPPKVKIVRLNGRDVCSLSTTSQFNPTPLSQHNNGRAESEEGPVYNPRQSTRDPGRSTPTTSRGTQVNHNNNGYETILYPSNKNNNDYEVSRTTSTTTKSPIYYGSSGNSHNNNYNSSNSGTDRNIYNAETPGRDRNTNIQESKKNAYDHSSSNSGNRNSYHNTESSVVYNQESSTRDRETHNQPPKNVYNTNNYDNGEENVYIRKPYTINNNENVYTVSTPRTQYRPSTHHETVYKQNEYTSSSDRTTPRSQYEYSSKPKPTRKPSRGNSYDYNGGDDDDYNNGDSTKKKRKGNDSGNFDYFEGDHRVPSAEKIRPTKDPEHSNSEEACGKVEIKPAPLIVNGQVTEHGEWPWHVALYQSQTVDNKYICGGSLVSLNHIVTAAHCVTRKNSIRIVNVATLTVYLGKFNLRKFTEGVQIMIVKKIYVHPEYNATNFYADLSVLKFTKPAEYTKFVRPVCLWNEEETSLRNIIGREGSVVGWGFDEESHVTEELSLVKMPIVEQATCLWSFKEFYTHFTSNRSFCAGYANGTSVCNGDSGGGLVLPDESYGSSPTWKLRGLVSISVARQNEYVCDPFHYVVFTDVAQFLPWIKRILSL